MHQGVGRRVRHRRRHTRGQLVGGKEEVATQRTLDLLRTAGGRLEGTVITEPRTDQALPGKSDPLRVLEGSQLEDRDDDRRPL